MMSSDNGVSSGYEQKRISRLMGKRDVRTYESPVDSTYGTQGADSRDSQSELVRLCLSILVMVVGRRDQFGGKE